MINTKMMCITLAMITAFSEPIACTGHDSIMCDIQTIPETEEIEIIECTPAPDDIIIPEIEEHIHIEHMVEEVIEQDDITPEPVPEPEPEPVVEEEPPAPAINPDELELLACVIYQEAGGDSQCDECRRRVADVVLNRVNDSRFPNSIHKVLTAKNQYGNFHKTGVVWPKRAKYAGEKHAVERAYRIAEEVLSGHHSDLYGQGYIWQARFKQSNDNVYCCGHYYGR